MVLASLNLQGKKILFVGGGVVATRKLSNLLNYDAERLLISPQITEAIQTWLDDDLLKWSQTNYHSDSLNVYQPNIVFAATDNPQLNQQIANDARKIGAWVNNASDGDNSDFHTIATIEKSPIRIGISTKGTSPALIKIIKQRIEQVLRNDIVQLAQWISEIRPTVKHTIPTQSARQDLFRRIVESDILDLLQDGKIDSARARFDAFTEGIS